MTDQEAVTLTSSGNSPEGSPAKGFKQILSWASWVLQSIIAVSIAILVWGKLEGPSILDISLSALGIVGLFTTVKWAIGKKWDLGSYLFLYITFFIGLHLYRWLWNTLVAPGAWHSYWWIPFIPLALVTLKLPLIDVGISTFVSRVVFMRLEIAIFSVVIPFQAIYMTIDAICHPKRTIAFIGKNVVATLSVLLGFVACSLVMRLLVPSLVPPPILITAVVVYFILATVCCTVTIVVEREKIDIIKTRWAGLVTWCGRIALPFLTVIMLSRMINNPDAVSTGVDKDSTN